MNLILSADHNWGLGCDNHLLFKVAPDMRRFRDKTIGGVVVMGRKTLESLPGGTPLKDRINVVMTRDPGRIGIRGDRRLRVCGGLRELSCCLNELAIEQDQVWVAGGAEIYRLLLPYSKNAYVTRILTAAEKADCWMENLDAMADWLLVETGEIQEWEGLRFRYDRYRNTKIKQLPK